MDFESFSEWHKRAREQRGLSQRDVAKKLGWSSAQYISNIERGIALLPKTSIKEISKIYKVSPTYIALLLVGDIRRDLLQFLKKH